MKNIGWVSILVFCTGAFGQSVPFGKLGHPFLQPNIALVWAAATNDLPHGLWVYRALPSEVTPKAISNLMRLGSFTERDRKKIPDYPRLISYADPTGKRTLLINPEWSYIYYKDSDANDMKIVEGVPDANETFKMATEWLPKLGIDRNQLAKKPHSSDLQFQVAQATTILYKDHDGPAYATNIHMREITFMRALDAVKISGGSARGGGSIGFGHHGKISLILVAWRKLERDKLFPVVSPEDLLKCIREGKAVWYSPPDSPSFNWSSMKKLVITKATPYYYAEGYAEYDKPLNWVSPFAELETRVESDQTNSVIYLDCPIIAAPVK